jgi:hypothetical protein
MLKSGGGVDIKNESSEWNWNGVGIKNVENAHHWSKLIFCRPSWKFNGIRYREIKA